MKKELILAFNRKAVLEMLEDIKHLPNKEQPKEFLSKWDIVNNVFIPRCIAETSSEYIHPIPYFLIENQDGEVLVYQRGKGVGESRLLGNHSVGFGGHVDLEHTIEQQANSNHTILMLNASRSVEMDEEVSYSNFCYETWFQDLGVIYDSSNEVGKVHLGFVSVIRHLQKGGSELTLNEGELINCGWHNPEDILEKHEQGSFNLENWSVTSLQYLIESNQ